MNKRIRRLSFGLAALLCLHGFTLSAAENDAPAEPQPTAVQETVAPTPASEEPGPANTETPPETTIAPDATATLAPSETPEYSASPDPTEEPEATEEPEETPEPTEEPELSPEPTEEVSPAPSDEATPSPEPTKNPSAEPAVEPSMEPAPEPSAEETLNPSETPAPDYICGLSEHAHGAECYDEAQNLICELPEHAHGESCVLAPTPTPIPEEEDQSAEDVPQQGEMILAARVNDALWRSVKPSDERGMAIPMLFQGDYAQIVCTLGGRDRSVATSGCGATSLSMVIAYLTGNTDQNPYKLFCDSVDAGRYHGSGWSHETLSRYAAEYGVHSRWISNDADAVLRALREGRPVIAHMGPGIFTNRGHYLVLRGVTEDGLVLMNDPNSPSNCEMAFPMKTLLKQTKTSAAFMVCWSDDMAAFEMNAAREQKAETLWGDLNGSGSVDINDAQILYKCLQDGTADEACDLNGDGAVDQADLDALVEAILNPEEMEGGDPA